MTQTANVRASIDYVRTAAPDAGSSRVEQKIAAAIELANGITDGKADLAFLDARTLASNTPESIDLSGSLTGADGLPVVFAEVCAILIENPATNTTALTIGNVTNGAQLFFGGAAHTVVLAPGDFILVYAKAGWAITATTADLLKIANASGASNTYNLALIGRSA